MFKQSASGEKKMKLLARSFASAASFIFFPPELIVSTFKPNNSYMKHAEKLTFSKNYIKNCHFYSQFQEKPAKKNPSFPIKTQQMEFFCEKTVILSPWNN